MALFGLQSLACQASDTHIKIYSDNTITVCAINKMGTSRSISCDQIAKQIWQWAMERRLWISAAHVPGIYNEKADAESRKFEIHTEWMLNKIKFLEIHSHYDFHVNVDLFASRVNKQIQKFVSYRPDPECYAVDAFSIPWSNLQFYAFPPFICITKALNKIIRDEATGIIVVPNWPTQAWYPLLLRVLVKEPFCLYSSQYLLQLPNIPMMKHPLWRKLELLACLVSGSSI